MTNPTFIEYDTQAEEQKLVKLFEEKTGSTLYPAQDERLLISIIEYKAALLVNLFNEAAKLNLTQYSKAPILDYIGEMFDTPRLMGEKGIDTIQFELNTTFGSDFKIPKGTEILSKDETHIFETVEDLILPAGETTGTVGIEAKENGSAVNVYGAGDVNILVKPLSYVESVTNLNGITGGADEESDEAYKKRILLAPEKFTCAGSQKSYVYHALSSNASIIDATAQSVQTPASLQIGETVYTEENGQIETPDFTVSVDYRHGKFNFSLNEVEYSFTMPTDTTVNIYPLTDGGQTPQNVLDDVERVLNGESVNPMTDRVVAISPIKIEKTITLSIQVERDADLETTTARINEAIEAYKADKSKKLNIEILPSQIIARVGSIEGVYVVNTGDLQPIKAKINEYFELTFNTEVTQL